MKKLLMAILAVAAWLFVSPTAALAQCQFIWESSGAGGADVHLQTHLLTGLFECEVDDDNGAHANYTTIPGQGLVSAVNTDDSFEGFNEVQAGIFLENLAQPQPAHRLSIEFRSQFSDPDPDCFFGPFLVTVGKSNGVKYAQIQPLSNGSFGNTKANGFQRVSFFAINKNTTLTTLGILTTHNGRYLLDNLTIDGQVIPEDTHQPHKAGCIFGTDLFGGRFDCIRYCGSVD